jgi:hypothetical protein
VSAASEHGGWRYRSLVLAGVLVAVVVATGLLAGRSGPNKPGTHRPRVSFGAQVEQLGATSDLVYTNGWVASSGTQAVGVYAGSQRFDRRNGLFVIMRQTGNSSRQKLTRVIVHGSGAVTMLRPAPPATQDAAFQTTLHFVTANGGTGTLDLSNDKVSLSG